MLSKYWLEHYKDFNPRNLSAVGYADTRPVSIDPTPEGMAKNRRIEIVLKMNTLIGPADHQYQKPGLPLEPYLFSDKYPVPEEDYIPPSE